LDLIGPTGVSGYTGPIGNTGYTGPIGPTGMSYNFSNLISYTPILQDSLGNTLNPSSYKFRIGQYLQVGNLIWFQVNIGINNKSGLGSLLLQLQVTLPKPSTSTIIQSLNVSNILYPLSNISWINAQVPAGTNISYCNFPVKNSQLTNNEFLKNNDVSTSFEIYFGGWYFSV
jgi:hypothetical protein